ncbi:MAG: AraC family transcriptional regulator [Ahniella sp.]|nr:AraC family transcriptional regulator [Ahniella sp.]
MANSRATRIRPVPTGPSGAALPALYLRQIADQLRTAEVSVAAWLSSCGVSAAVLDDDAPALPEATFRQLVRTALTLSREPALGLLVGARMLPDSHGLVGLAARHSKTLGEALELVEHFLGLRTSLVQVKIERGKRQVRLRLIEPRSLRDLQVVVLEAVSLALKNLLDAVAMRTDRIEEVRFPFPAPRHHRLAEQWFGCRVRYGSASACLCVPIQALNEPLRHGNAEAYAHSVAVCAQELERLHHEQSLTASIQRLLLERHHGFPSLTTCARLLHQSPRTLHRRLQDEGQTWRQLVDTARRHRAVAQLQSGRFTVDQVAALLGYTDVANFRRAFKRWTGQTPGDCRGEVVWQK